MAAIQLDQNEFSNLYGPALSSFAQTIGDMVMKQVSAEISGVTVKPLAEAIKGEGMTSLAVQFESGLPGALCVRFSTEEACKLANTLMGTDPDEEIGEKLSEMQASALGEVINQAVGGMSTTLGSQLGTTISHSPVINIDAAATESKDYFGEDDIAEVAVVNIDFSVQDVVSGQIVHLLPDKTVKALTPAATQSSSPAVSTSNQPAQPGGQPTVQSVSFGQLSEKGIGDNSNIDMLLDVNLTVTVELGRTRLTIKEILGLSQGSVVELDKLAGEPVDLMVNDKLFARGEVVVIDENFGVRVTEIVSQVARVDALR